MAMLILVHGLNFFDVNFAVKDLAFVALELAVPLPQTSIPGNISHAFRHCFNSIESPTHRT